MTRKNIEHEHQVALFQLAEMHLNDMPELELMYAIPNGDKRSISVAKRLKAEGVKKGIPDICLPIARHGYHALYIEMKRPASPGKAKGRVSFEQKHMASLLEVADNRVVVCYGWEEAWNEILWYLKGGKIQ